MESKRTNLDEYLLLEKKLNSHIINTIISLAMVSRKKEKNSNQEFPKIRGLF